MLPLLHVVFGALALYLFRALVRRPAQWFGGGLVIRPSTTPEAGLGVFSMVAIKAGTLVCTYQGALLDRATARSMRRADVACSSHMCNLQGSGYVIDGMRAIVNSIFPLGGDCGSMINCSDALHPANITKKVVATGGAYTRGTNDLSALGEVRMIARRDIRAGDELRFDYGKVYRHLHGLP